MKKTLQFYARIGWEEDFNKGDGWTFYSEFPNLYVNKEHIQNNNRRDWKEISENFQKYFTKVKVTIESV